MAIRSAVKTIVVKNEKILFIKYISDSGVVHYELPGGGQELFEEMEDAAKREFLEETGYQIKISRFAAIAEEIFEDEELRRNYPNHVHRIHHIFQGELKSTEIKSDINYDHNQICCEWIPIQEISEINLIPRQLKTNMNRILQSEYSLYLGTIFETMNFK